MKTVIHRMGYYVHQTITRTKRQIRWESIDLKTGEKKTRCYNQRSADRDFEADLTVNSQPTHRNAVLILESK